jgi:Tol biopolymer transport system component
VKIRRVVGVGVVGLMLVPSVVAVLPRAKLPRPLADVALLPERLWSRFLPPRLAGAARLEGLTVAEREAAYGVGRGLDGRLVWSSNRSGNHELYLLDLRGRSVRRLTDHPSVDFFSRFSPDGHRIVFLRSQRPWVSFRDKSAWDVMLVNADGSGARRLAIGGYHPTWAANGRAIIFERGMRVVRYDLASGQEEMLLDGTREFPGASDFGDVELSPDGQRLAFGLRGQFAGAFGLQGKFSGAAVLDLSTRVFAPLTDRQACQTTWTPDGKRVLWMATGGRGGTQVMAAGPDGSGREVFADLPGTHSHEYFPKVSNDGRWLVWGAAAEGHEHDRADYELFLWRIGTPLSEAARLTYHPANDQWPDLYVRR